MASKQLIYISNIFDALGFNTQFTSSTHHKLTQYIPFLFHVIFAIIHAGFCVKISEYINDATDNLATVNNFVQYVAATSAYWLIIFEMYERRKNRKNFWKLFRKIDKYMNRPWRLFPILFIEYMSFSILIFLYYFINLENIGLSQFVTSMVYLIAVKMCELKLLLHLFFLNVVLYQLHTLEQKLNKIIKHKSIYPKLLASELSSAKFHRIEKIYIIIIEMINELNQIFGWSQFAVITFAMLFIITMINWAVLNGFEELNFHSICK